MQNPRETHEIPTKYPQKQEIPTETRNTRENKQTRPTTHENKQNPGVEQNTQQLLISRVVKEIRVV